MDGEAVFRNMATAGHADAGDPDGWDSLYGEDGADLLYGGAGLDDLFGAPAGAAAIPANAANVPPGNNAPGSASTDDPGVLILGAECRVSPAAAAEDRSADIPLIADFDPAAEKLVLGFDPATCRDPVVSVSTEDTADGRFSVIRLGGAPVARVVCLPGETRPLTTADIALVTEDEIAGMETA